MLSSWIKVHFLIVMSLDKGLQVYSEGSDYSHCSCYTFDGRLKSWSYGRQQCRTQGGDLVSMETVEEWEFIKTQIQNRTTAPRGHNEWWIGLEKRDGRWEWLSNHPLTYDKWQPNKPNNGQDEKCVVIARNYPSDTHGLFNDAPCDMWRGWICEYKIKADCSNNQVKWCENPVTPTVMTLSKTDQEEVTTTTATTTTTAAATTTTTTATTTATTTTTTAEAATTSGRKTATSDPTISTTVRQSTTKKTTTNYGLNVPSPSTTTASNKNQPTASEYPTPTTTPYKKYTEKSTNTETDIGTPTNGSQTTKKPFHILTIIIAVLVVVGAVVFLCCVVLCVCGWKRKRKGKPRARVKHDDKNTDNNTSDVMVGSSNGFHVNEHELKAIVIQPNACAQEDSHDTTHKNASDNSTDTQEVTKSSHGYLVSQKTHDSLEVRNHGKDSNQNKGKTESSNPTKKETTEVVYAEVNKRSKNPADQHEDLVTYAELADFNHDASLSVPKVPPPYQPTEYANVSTMPVRCQDK